MSMAQVSEARSVVDAVRTLVTGFDPDVTLARDAMDLVAVFGEIENLGAAGKSLAANKVAGTELWRRKGFKSAAAWLASTTGTGMGDAVNALTTAAALQGLDATTESYTSGKLSPRQAKAVATAAAADPNAEQELLATAASAPVTDLEAKAREIRIAASPESAEQRHARVHAERHVRTWVDDDAGYGQWKFTLADHARFVALLDAQKDRIFRTARSEGRREPDQAYAADALLSLLDAVNVTPAAGQEGSEPTTDGRAHRSARDVKVIVRVDDTALRRGHTVDGEVCEIAGVGSVPVSVVQEWVEGDAFKAAIVVDGTDIRSVVHLGRRPLALQRTALEWIGADRCSIRHCTSSARLEIDHVADWATTRQTVLDRLTPACGHHHDLKTYHGFRFGPLEPDGRRALMTPDGSRADGPLLDHPPPASFSGDDPPGESSPLGLFDTG